MTIHLPLWRTQFSTVISIYSPPMTSSDEVKEKLYEGLHAFLLTVPKADKMVVLVDFEAPVGADEVACEGGLVPVLSAAVTKTDFFFCEPARGIASCWTTPPSGAG
nr:unnamed protein product [Spirometra erinaceieuropaei]